MPLSEVSLGQSLRAVAGRIGQRHSREVARLGVTLAESELLRALYDCGAVAPSVIAARMGLTRGAVSKLVDRLRAKRLVVRAAGGTDDRRFQTVALTGAGATLVPALLAAEAASEAATFALLSVTDRAALRAMLSVLSSPAQSEIPDDSKRGNVDGHDGADRDGGRGGGRRLSRRAGG